jgi:hypothetical protein
MANIFAECHSMPGISSGSGKLPQVIDNLGHLQFSGNFASKKILDNYFI